MARKKVETNISFDEMRQKYYVCMDYGLDETGKRVKKYTNAFLPHSIPDSLFPANKS